MESILKDLYYGRISPDEINRPILKNLKEFQDKMRIQEDQFIGQLTEEQIRQFDLIMEERLLAVDLEFADTFVAGFQLGACMMLEIFEIKIPVTK